MLTPLFRLDDKNMSIKKSEPPLLNREVFYQGQTIIEQDCDAYRAYFIEDGQVEITVREGKHEITVSNLEKGEIFGEMSLLSDQKRIATAKAITDCTLTIISKETLERKIESIEDPAIRAIIRLLVRRLREANSGQLHHYKNFAEFQDRISSLTSKADKGIDDDKKEAIKSEAEPLLEQLEGLLDKYNQ